MSWRKADPGALLDIRALEASLTAGGRILAGVSGGADSIALLLALSRVVARCGFEIVAGHVNHQLRPEAAAEEEFVRRLCARVGIPLLVRRLENAVVTEGGSVEAHWRRLRYAAFADMAREVDATAVALGHTADDLAETFLFHLVRGTGVNGLIFQFETRQDDLRILRPLWKTSRAAIETALAAEGQSWVTDPSNLDVQHTRNFLRHRVMPLLREINPNASTAILRASEAIEEESRPSRRYATDGESTESVIHAVARGNSEQLRLSTVQGSGSDNTALSFAVRRFVQEQGLHLDSRQTAQAVNIIVDEKVGTVSLAGAKTFVITQEFAWISNQQEPSILELAQEHAVRFGGVFASLDSPVPLQKAAGDVLNGHIEIRTLNGGTHAVQVTGAPEGCALLNRAGAGPERPRLKKLLNEHKIPWYLRDYMVFLVTPAAGEVIAAIGADDRLADAIARRTKHQVSIHLVPLSASA